jgi:SPOR domain
MADDTHFRSYRQRDPRTGERSPVDPASGRQGGSDPLAELARLIGQTDPFVEASRGGPGRAVPRAPHQGAAGGMPQQPGAAPPSTPYGQNPPESPLAPPRGDPPPFENQAPIAPQAGGFEPAYDPAIYGSAPQAAGYGSQGYHDDAAAMPRGEEVYDDEYFEKPPRRGLKTVAMLIGLAIIGTGAAFGYRALFGSSSSGPPPVIKADAGPNKVAPPSKKEASNKLINDRVGNSGQGEKIVSREEQPMDVPHAARSMPGNVLSGVPTAADASATASPPLASMPVSPDVAEPKRIHTVTIRPDQPLGEAIVPKASVTPSTPRSDASVRAAPAAAAASAASAPRSLAPPAPPAPARHTATAHHAAAPSNAPLSLTPQQVNTPAPSRAAAAAPTRVASTNPAPAGSYAVQISSQRSETDARSSFHSLQVKFPKLLGGRQPIIRRADLGSRGIYYRTMVGPFASLNEASDFCRNLKAAGGQCLIQRN